MHNFLEPKRVASALAPRLLEDGKELSLLIAQEVNLGGLARL